MRTITPLATVIWHTCPGACLIFSLCPRGRHFLVNSETRVEETKTGKNSKILTQTFCENNLRPMLVYFFIKTINVLTADRGEITLHYHHKSRI